MASIKKLFRDGVLANMPTATRKRFVDGCADLYSYQATLPDGSPNPQGKQAFAAQCARNWMNEVAKASERKVSVEAVPMPPDIDDDAEDGLQAK